MEFTAVEPGEMRDGELKLELLESGFQAVHKVPAYSFRMVHAATREELGTIRLRVGSSRHVEMFAGHIGYGVHAAYRGRRYAARSVRLLMPFALQVGLDPIWITCDPENLASRRSLERAGAVFVEIVDVPEDCVIRQSGHSRKCRYRLDLHSGVK